jgi:hypothetical protein
MQAKRRRERTWLAARFFAGFVLALFVLSVMESPLDSAASGGTSSSTTALVTAEAGITPTSPPTSSATKGPSTTTSASTSSTTTTTTIYVHPVNDPVRIVIPSAKVDAALVPVGLLENGDMEVPPFGLVGWYSLGPAPGANGPAVIVGHVDTKSGPDMFYYLKDLKTGDEIDIYGRDGDVAVFVVDSSEQELKIELPTERIWNSTQEPVIRLITCTGSFDRSSGHYLSNLIVYGHLVH